MSIVARMSGSGVVLKKIYLKGYITNAKRLKFVSRVVSSQAGWPKKKLHEF